MSDEEEIQIIETLRETMSRETFNDLFDMARMVCGINANGASLRKTAIQFSGVLDG